MPSTPKFSLPEPIKLIAVDSIDSTNERARLEAIRGCDDFTLVWARHQTAGRGTRGRTWISPRGNLFWSLVVRPAPFWRHVDTLSYTAAVAVGELLLKYGAKESDVSYKWPNDVLVNGKKISGVLIEASFQPTGKSLNDEPKLSGNFDWLVIGVGINNVAYPPAQLTRYPATSIAEMIGRSIAIENLVGDYTRSFLKWFARWRDNGFTQIREKIMQRLIGVTDEINVRIGDADVRGKFTDILEDGTAIFRSLNNERICIRSGEVIYSENVNQRYFGREVAQ